MIKWGSLDYEKVSDKVIVELRDYVSWKHVLNGWGDQMRKYRTDKDHAEFKRTGDILKYKNFVDWNSKFVEWGIKNSQHIGFEAFVPMPRSTDPNHSLTGFDELIDGLI